MPADDQELQQVIVDARRYRAFRAAGLPNGLGVYDEELDQACDQLADDMDIQVVVSAEDVR